MPPVKRTTCKICGAPRDLTRSVALCTEHALIKDAARKRIARREVKEEIILDFSLSPYLTEVDLLDKLKTVDSIRQFKPFLPYLYLLMLRDIFCLESSVFNDAFISVGLKKCLELSSSLSFKAKAFTASSPTEKEWNVVLGHLIVTCKHWNYTVDEFYATVVLFIAGTLTNFSDEVCIPSNIREMLRQDAAGINNQLILLLDNQKRAQVKVSADNGDVFGVVRRFKALAHELDSLLKIPNFEDDKKWIRVASSSFLWLACLCMIPKLMLVKPPQLTQVEASSLMYKLRTMHDNFKHK